ncbi:hypothetical protein [Roseomonas chloroacetimidivorans]|uniref:hypothetical protein n=1 Tax=Roseomonas chloroacetimidivorans TaxID=1766656 RepID=UPI003C756FD4
MVQIWILAEGLGFSDSPCCLAVPLRAFGTAPNASCLEQVAGSGLAVATPAEGP